jgi:hypothetical protein
VINVDVAAGIAEAASSNAVRIYPNPVSDEATITVSKEVKVSNGEFHLYDMLGKEVISETNIQSNSIRIGKKDLPAGSYYYKFINAGKQIGSGKLLIK